MTKFSDHWLKQFAPSSTLGLEELGAAGTLERSQILDALKLAKTGTVYDLDAGRWSGMAVHPVHPPFTITTYRTPRGMLVDNGPRETDDSFVSELIVSSMHAGAHIDALCHVTCGHDNHWRGGRTEAEDLGDVGAKTYDGAALPPFICRGVLVDIPPAVGLDYLEPGHGIGWSQVEAALDAQGTELRRGDAVFFRTGFMRWWLQGPEQSKSYSGAGINLEVATILAEKGVVLAGSDTEGFEQLPAPQADQYLPVHVELLINHGIHIIELAYLDQLAADNVHEFLFLCLPLRIAGSTGSMVRPVAII